MTTPTRNARYCEVFVISGFFQPEAFVWNTWSVNECPADCWDGLTTNEIAEIAAASGIPQVRGAEKNGPRYWTMDNIQATQPPGATFNFDCLGCKQVAVLPLSGSEVSGFKPPYEDQTVNRNTIYTFNANEPLFMLTNPQGQAYVMQSYTTMVDSSLTYDQLANLKSQLTLPQGWDYKVGTCKSNFTLQANGTTVVVQDNLRNTYQKVANSIANQDPLTCSGGSSSSSSLWWLWLILGLILAFIIIFVIFYLVRNSWSSAPAAAYVYEQPQQVMVQQQVVSTPVQARPATPIVLDKAHSVNFTVTPYQIVQPPPPPPMSQVTIPVPVPPGSGVMINGTPYVTSQSAVQ